MDEGAVPLLETMPREDEEVEADDGAPDVAFEGWEGLPSTSAETEDPLEERDATLDTGPEIAQASVDPSALRHFGDLESAALEEHHVLDALGLGIAQVGS